MTSSTINDATVHKAADRLSRAAASGYPCTPVRDLIGADATAAYAVQRELTARRRSGGARVVGRKVGLTSPAVQAQLGVSQPDFGVLFDDMTLSSGDTVPRGRLLQPKVEAEVAFVLGADLDTDALDASDVRAAVKYAVAAIEIVDSRIAQWDITFADTVADNGSSGLFVLGSQRRTLAEFDPVDVDMTLRRGDDTVSTGTGSACLGDPLNALLWLARTSQHLEIPLRAGDVVLSGALGPMVAAGPGDTFCAEITQLGTVTINFDGGQE